MDRAIEQADRERRHRYAAVVGLASAAVVVAVSVGVLASSPDRNDSQPVGLATPTGTTPETPPPASPEGPSAAPAAPLVNDQIQVVEQYLADVDTPCEGCEDADSIAFDARTGRLLLAWRSFTPDDVGRLRVVGASGQLAELTCSAEISCPPVGPYWWWTTLGPGATELSIDGGPGKVLVVDHRGAVRRTIDLPSPLGEDEVVRQAAWSPDGSRLAVQTRAGGRTGMVSNIWLVDRDGGNPQLVHTAAYTGPLGNADAPLGYIWSVSWSPDGSRLGFIEEHARIGKVSEDSLSLQAVSLRLPGPGEDGPVDARSLYELKRRAYDEAEFLWSPDGARVAVRIPDQVLELSAKDGNIVARHPFVEDDNKPSAQLVWPASHP